MRNNFYMGIFASLIAVMCCFAQDRVPDVRVVKFVDGTVSTPTRQESDLLEVPYSAYTLDGSAKQVEESVRTTPDVFKGLPSVLVQKTAHGQGSPFLRGFTGFRTLFLIDGIRLNNSVFRDGPNQYWNTVDPLSIRDYEIVMGPASVLYGSDAVGGTVNALTLEPPTYEGEPVWEKRLYYRGATAERSHIGRVQLGARPTEAFGFGGGVSIKDFGDLEGGEDVGRQSHTGYQELDYDAKFNWTPSDRATLTLAHQAVAQDDAWRTHRTIYGIDWEGLTQGDDQEHILDQERDLTYLRLQADELGSWVDGVDVTLSRHVQEEDLFRLRKDSTSDTQGFDVTTWGASVELDKETDAGTWVVGTEYYYDDVDSFARKFNVDGSLNKIQAQGPIADDAEYHTVGAYAQNTLTLFNEQLELTPGVRYNYAKVDAKKVQDPVSGDVISLEEDWDTVVGSLRALHPLDDQKKQALFAGVSQGFRAPNLSDLTRLDTARSTEIETPVTDLDPEQFISYEIGLRSNLEKLQSQIAYYYTDIDDLIVRTPTGRIIDELNEVTKKNSGDGYVQGVELSLNYEISDAWLARFNITWMEGEVEAYPTSDPVPVRDDLSRVMPLTARAALRWQPKVDGFWLEAVCDAADDADKLSADDKRDTQRIPPGGTPGYTVFTVRGGVPVTKNIDLTLAVENMADEDYRIHGSGVNEPGRNFVLTAVCDF